MPFCVGNQNEEKSELIAIRSTPSMFYHSIYENADKIRKIWNQKKRDNNVNNVLVPNGILKLALRKAVLLAID